MSTPIATWRRSSRRAVLAGRAGGAALPPLALAGEIATRAALRESQDRVNQLFAQRPKEWEI